MYSGAILNQVAQLKTLPPFVLKTPIYVDENDASAKQYLPGDNFANGHKNRCIQGLQPRPVTTCDFVAWSSKTPISYSCCSGGTPCAIEDSMATPRVIILIGLNGAKTFEGFDKK
jgi:hypothetical protein